MSKVFKGCGCQTLGVGPLGNKDCCAPALVEALEMVRHYRDSHMGASSSKVTQIYRGEMNDKIDAALAAAYGEKE